MAQFTRTIEDFVCQCCGAEVGGTGYTNHCPNCLWSKHVDVSPGDRLSACGGMMEPIGIDKKGEDYIIIHRCIVCGFEKRNKKAPNDNFDEILKVLKR